ncbi:hypothetical protein SAMN02745245_01121 [Anaerosphaera aminiphila DSM 21120]|uniref:Uncharacterized protein n=1 Tax=Anaerosphaera aminiphila DSM 21120 TaxID=1120995 RepID=A0A1M5SA59_9FIRM|nr:hypothetical protein [Anaerosphaera aminiphila]SHH35361.1 hypothetical protein SAMN02745245_01121 [Anaerosphaera aminiphila DSM 21120]
MKKEHLQKIFIGLAVILIALQFVYREIKWKTGVYNEYIRIAEYVVIALVMIVGIFFVRAEDKRLVKGLLIIYAALILLFFLFKFKNLV